MRLATWAMLGALALGGCGERPAPASAPLLPSKLAGPEATVWNGVFAPVGSNREQAPGDMTLTFAGFGQPGAVQFGSGVVLQTRPVRQPHPDQPYNSRRVDTWADLLGMPAGGEVEVRQVISEATPPGAVGLCGEEPPAWVAIGLRPGQGAPGSVSMAAFRGVDVPGRERGGSEICAVFEYAPSR